MVDIDEPEPHTVGKGVPGHRRPVAAVGQEQRQHKEDHYRGDHGGGGVPDDDAECEAGERAHRREKCGGQDDTEGSRVTDGDARVPETQNGLRHSE